MRKNRLFILGIFTVMVALVSLSMVSGTWAKYTSTVSGSDSARVAKWDVKVNTVKGTSTTQTVTFDLFSTTAILDTNGGATETDVTNNQADDKNVIAPGTKGQVTFALRNDSEVSAEYKVNYTITNPSSIPVQFSTDGTNWKDDIDELDIDTAVAIAMSGGNTNIILYWQWDFDGDDTALGTMATLPEIKIDAEFVFDQVD